MTSDADLVALFGLSAEEAGSLGLPLPAATEQVSEQEPIDSHNASGPDAFEEMSEVAVAAEMGQPIQLEHQDVSRVPMSEALQRTFFAECASLLDNIHLCLEQLEQRPAHEHADAIDGARRSMHTLKGAAAVCGQDTMAIIAHMCEDMLDLLNDRPGASCPPECLRLLFDGEMLLRNLWPDHSDLLADEEQTSDTAHFVVVFTTQVQATCAMLIQALPQQPAPLALLRSPQLARPQVPGRPLAQTTSSSTPPLAPPTSPVRRFKLSSEHRQGPALIQLEVERINAVVDQVTELLSHRAAAGAALSQITQLVEDAIRQAHATRRLLADLEVEYLLTNNRQREERRRTGELRHVSTLTPMPQLMARLNELLADQEASLDSLRAVVNSQLATGLSQHRLDAEIQKALLNIRLVPLGDLRVRLDGVIRSTASTAGKQVTWRMDGQNVAVDKNVFDRLFEPLMHLLRNAIDHGLESAQDRTLAGKPETGTVIITAYDDGGQIVITVSDDGRGINPDHVANRAVERRIISHNRVIRLSRQAKLELIFLPGFSTTTAVSSLSGRGVGMDVVRDTCTSMGGSVSLTSRPGRGTTMMMRLPLSLSLARAMIVRDGPLLMAINVTHIRAIHTPTDDELIRDTDGFVFQRGDVRLPLVRLPRPSSPLIGYAPSLPTLGASGLAGPPAGYVRPTDGFVLEALRDGVPVGVLVADLVGEQELLLKALPAMLRPVTTLLAGVMLPDGQAIPLLNLPQILLYAHPVSINVTNDLDRRSFDTGSLASSNTSPGQAHPDSAEPGTPGTRRKCALVVDDSPTVRFTTAALLDTMGIAVVQAGDGVEALKAIDHLVHDRQRVHLIILDIDMPRMDGLEFLHALRRRPGGKDILVFVVSARGDATRQRAALALGVRRFFGKPYAPDKLRAAIAAALSIE